MELRTIPPSWRNPAGLAGGRTAPAAPGWHGVIVGRSWPVGFTEAEYRLLLVGGSRRRLAHPDGYSAHGAPLYLLTDAQRRVRERLLNRLCLDGYETENIACNAGRAVLLSFLGGGTGLAGPQYFAVGTGSGTPAATDTQLFAEYYRAAYSTTAINGNQIDVSTLFQSNVANTTYTEAGLFGNGATATANSGALFAHALYAYTKSSGTVLSNDYYIVFN